MRDPRYRAIAVNTGEFVESMTIAKGTIKRKSGKYYFEMSPSKWVGVKYETLGTYSNVEDENNINICSGDIILTGGDSGFMTPDVRGHYIVKHTDGEWDIPAGFYLAKKEDQTYSDGSLCVCDSECFEVVGDIHTTPELLKK